MSLRSADGAPAPAPADGPNGRVALRDDRDLLLLQVKSVFASRIASWCPRSNLDRIVISDANLLVDNRFSLAYSAVVSVFIAVAAPIERTQSANTEVDVIEGVSRNESAQ